MNYLEIIYKWGCKLVAARRRTIQMAVNRVHPQLPTVTYLCFFSYDFNCNAQLIKK